MLCEWQLMTAPELDPLFTETPASQISEMQRLSKDSRPDSQP